MPRSRQDILLNFKLKNEASRANLKKNKVSKWRPFWKNVSCGNRLVSKNMLLEQTPPRKQMRTTTTRIFLKEALKMHLL